MTKEDAINKLIEGCETDKISDGYHTFGELYEHRIALFILVAKHLEKTLGYEWEVWRSQCHSDGMSIEGWFLLGINSKATKQITYHLPMSEWGKCAFAETLERAPEWDGHTSKDVLERLNTLL